MKKGYRLTQAVVALINGEVIAFKTDYDGNELVLELVDEEIRCTCMGVTRSSIPDKLLWDETTSPKKVVFTVALDYWIENGHDIYCVYDGFTRYFKGDSNCLMSTNRVPVTREEILNGEWYVVSNE